MEILERRAGPQERALVESFAYMSKGKDTLQAVSGLIVKAIVGSQQARFKPPTDADPGIPLRKWAKSLPTVHLRLGQFPWY